MISRIMLQFGLHGRFQLLLIAGLMSTLMSNIQAAVTTTYNAIDVPVTIPEVAQPIGSLAGTTTSTLSVTNVTTEVSRIDVSLWITHSYPSDLTIRLVPPDPATGAAGTGQGIILAQYVTATNVLFPDGVTAPSGNNTNGAATTGFGSGLANPPNGRVVFSDSANDPITFADPTEVNNIFGYVHVISGTYSPQQALSAFNGLTGLAINGVWTLLVTDNDGRDGGNLVAWSMSVTEPGIHTWSGLGGDSEWGTANNWVGNNPPGVGEQWAQIVFPSGPTNVVANNNIGDISVKSLTMVGGYTIGGNSPITMNTNSTISVSAGTTSAVSIGGAGQLQLVGTTSITVGTGLSATISRDIVNNTLAVPGTLIKTGLGTLAMTGATNSYSGLTTISQGLLTISDNTGLGTGAEGTVVSNGATLGITAGVTVANETLSITGTGTSGQGAVVASGGAVVWDGAVTLVGSISGVGANGVAFTLNQPFTAATGRRLLRGLGTGTITLNGALPVGAVTDLSVNGATLVLANVPQPNVGSLTLESGTIRPTQQVTLGGSITSSGTSTLDTGTINLAGGRTATVTGALNAISTFNNGSLAIRGGGTVNWQSTSNAVSLSLNNGTLTGAGSSANLSVSKGKLAFAGGAGHATGNLALGSDAWFVFANAASRVTATGVVNISDAVLQPFATGIIIANSSNAGAFRFYTRTPASLVEYNNGTGNIEITANPGSTVQFVSLSYTGRENGPPVQLSLQSSALVNVAITSAGGGLDPDGDFVEIDSTPINMATTVDLTINDDYVEEGTESGELIIVPLNALCVASLGNATLTITDNDEDDHKPCGFGTGLTVFLLLGFGLLLNARLRRH